MPIIATQHCDIPDEVIHGKTGLLAEEGDIKALSDDILTFSAMGQSEYDEYANNARAHVENSFDIETSAINLLTKYESTLADG